MRHLFMPARLAAHPHLWLWLPTTALLLIGLLHGWYQWQTTLAQEQQLTQQLQHLRLTCQQHQDRARLLGEAQPLIQHWQQQGLLDAPRPAQWSAILLASQQRMQTAGKLRHELHAGHAWQTRNTTAATPAAGIQQHALQLHWQGVSELEVLAMLEDFSSQLPAPVDIRSCHFARASARTPDHDSQMTGLDVSCQLLIYSGHQHAANEDAA